MLRRGGDGIRRLAWILALGHLGLGAPALAQDATRTSELTIRNVSGATVEYRIGPPNGGASSVEARTLAPNAIDRFGIQVPWQLWFQKGPRIVTYLVEPAEPYSFRLDEHDELELYDGSHGRADAPDLAPWVPAPSDVVIEMLELAQLRAEDVLFDLGCGDGRIVVAAAEHFGARGVGVDIDPQRVRESNEAARLAGVEDRVEFRLEDAMTSDISSATVMALYLLEESLGMMRPWMERQLRPGTRIVTLNYPVPGWEPETVVEVTSSGETFDLYLYRR